jgi:hypothetical protein
VSSRQAVDAGPVVDSVDQVVLHGIGRRIDQLVDHRLAIHQLHDAGLLTRPQVLPAAAQGVPACPRFGRMRRRQGFTPELSRKAEFGGSRANSEAACLTQRFIAHIGLDLRRECATKPRLPVLGEEIERRQDPRIRRRAPRPRTRGRPPRNARA